MDREAGEHFERILKLARSRFSDVCIVSRDISSKRAILKIRCRYQKYLISVSEILAEQTRWYSYYLLDEGRVQLGLDNFSDRLALRLKYGAEFTQHLDEPVPHLHTQDKQHLELTEEKTFTHFVGLALGLRGEVE